MPSSIKCLRIYAELNGWWRKIREWQRRDNENHLKNSSTVETVCSSYSVQFFCFSFFLLLLLFMLPSKKAKNKFCRTALHYAEHEKYEKYSSFVLFQVSQACVWFNSFLHSTFFTLTVQHKSIFKFISERDSPYTVNNFQHQLSLIEAKE